MSDAITIERQIQCVKREISYRERVYPRLVSAGKMAQARAKDELDAMMAVLATLERLPKSQSDLGFG